MTAGHDELLRAADALAARVPQPAPLARLAFNYRWSWTPGGPELFSSIDPGRWERCAENPVRLLGEVEPEALERVAADPGYLERLALAARWITSRLDAVVSADAHETPAQDEQELRLRMLLLDEREQVSTPRSAGGA